MSPIAPHEDGYENGAPDDDVGNMRPANGFIIPGANDDSDSDFVSDPESEPDMGAERNGGYQPLHQIVTDRLSAGDHNGEAGDLSEDGVVYRGSMTVGWIDMNEADDSLADEINAFAPSSSAAPSIPDLPSAPPLLTADEMRPTAPLPQPEPLKEDEIEQIKTVMAGINLPLESVPSWAYDIPEQEWKRKLYEKLGKDS